MDRGDRSLSQKTRSALRAPRISPWTVRIAIAAAIVSGLWIGPQATADPLPGEDEAAKSPVETERAKSAIEAERAKSAIADELLKDPENSELWVHLGHAWRQLKNLEESRRAFEKALALTPKNLRAQFMLALIYEKKELNAKAAAAWKACLDSPDPHVREVAQKHLHHLGIQ